MTSLIRYIFGAYPGRDAPIPPLVLPPRPIPSPSSLKRKGPSDGERDDGQDGIRPKFRRVETPSGSMSVSLGTPTKAAPSNFSEVQKQQYVTMWRLLSLNAGFQSAVSKSPGALHPLKELYSERRAAILAAGGSPQVDPFVARKRKVGDDGPADEGEEGARKRHAPERVDLQVRTFSMLGRKRQAEDEGRDDTVVGGSKRKKLEPKGSSLLSGGAPDAPKGRQPVADKSAPRDHEDAVRRFVPADNIFRIAAEQQAHREVAARQASGDGVIAPPRPSSERGSRVTQGHRDFPDNGGPAAAGPPP